MSNKLLKALTAATVLVAGVGSASAQDYDPLAVWNGFYGGFGVGYGWSEGSVSVEGIETIAGLFDESIGADDEAALSSIHLGYLQQSGSFVFGGQVTGILSDFNNTANASKEIIALIGPFRGGYVGGFKTTADAIELQTSGMFTVAGRVGFAHGNTLFYGIGGLASAEVKTNLTSSGQVGVCILINCLEKNGFDPENPTLPAGLLDGAGSGQTSERHYGFMVGGGIDHMVNKYLSFGVEYNYTKLGSETHSGNFSGSIVALGHHEIVDIDEEFKIKVDPDGLHQIKATASIHFY